MAEREVRIRFTGDTGVLKGQAGELRTLFANLVNDTDDTRDAGAKWADAYKQQSDRIRQEMSDITTSADVLAESLGPEMVDALERSGRSIDEQVQELIKLGLTHDDIRVSSDELAAAIIDRDDALRQSAGQAGDGIRKVADEADNSRSVLANMVGNSAQDIGDLAGISGTAGVALGQLAEYAADGNISLSGLAKTAGPMLVLGGALQLIASEQAKAARQAKALRDAQQALADGQVQKAAESLVETYSDLYAAADKLGISSDLVTSAITGNEDAFNEIARTVAGFGLDLRSLDVDQQNLVRNNNLTTMIGHARDGWREQGNELQRNVQLTGDVAAALSKATGVVEDNTQAVKRAEDAQRALTDARLSAIDATYGVQAAEDALLTAQETAAAATDDASTAVDEKRQADDAAAQAALQLAEAHLREAEAQAEANGQTLTAQERNKILIESLYSLLVTLAPNSPLAVAVRDMIFTLQGLPPETSVNVSVTGTEDSATRIGGVRASVDELPDEVTTDAAADVDQAIDELDELTTKIEGVPTSITTTFGLVGIQTAMLELDKLERKLKDVKSAADDAERSVSRVAD